jgi:hypothetical protein
MSLSVEPLKTVQVLEPRTRINADREYAILRGGNRVTWKPVISTSYSNSSIQFSAPPPSPGIIVDRHVKLQMTITFNFTFTGVPDGTVPLQLGSNDAPRAFPLSSVISTFNVTLNDAQCSINLNDVITCLERVHQPPLLRDGSLSTSPCEPDQFQTYSQYFYPPPQGGSNRNPLAGYGENALEQTRGGFPYNSILNPVNTPAVQSASVAYTFTEDFYLSPFLPGQLCGNEAGFFGVQTMDFNITLGNLARAWSHSKLGNNITAINATLSAAPVLLFNYITPNQIFPIPREVTYPYFVIQRYPTDANITLPPGSSTTVSSANIQLNSIPRRMYIYARQRNSDRDNVVGQNNSGGASFLDYAWTNTDTFAYINQLSVQWGNDSGLFASATPQDLYRMSKDNGVNLSWSQWSSYVGSIIAIEFGKDLGLDSVTAPGMLGTFQLQLTATIQNPSPTQYGSGTDSKGVPIPIPTGPLSPQNINYTLYIVTVSEGSWTITENRSIGNIGIVTPKDVLDSKESPWVDYKTIETVYGGDVFGGVKSMLSRLPKHMRRAHVMKMRKRQHRGSAGRGAGVMVSPLQDRTAGVGASDGGKGGMMHGRRRGHKSSHHRVSRKKLLGFGLESLGGQPSDSDEEMADLEQHARQPVKRQAVGILSRNELRDLA